MELESPPTDTSDLTSLAVMSWKRFAMGLYDGCIKQLCILSDRERMTSEAEELRQLLAGSATEREDTLSAKTTKERFEEQKHRDVLPDEIPAELPQGSTRLISCRDEVLRDAAEQVKAIDDFFESRRKAGQVRESKSPHSAPTLCVKKLQSGWRVVHAYNKQNDATIPAQTPIPRKDVIIDSMSKSTIYSALDLRDGFYQILMR
ncbi:reverse transcriptase [Phytophthora megakarya]|uniref:Reverse transcriptase n=1 Tax=Phytophthora megakarya TaxID=4795 RepID=A0A225UQL0_9STRA|nr:reverse transcriptase [Phytophthora megakarya]